MDMRPGHIVMLLAIFVLGFYVAKKWPTLFASVPLVGQYLT